MATLSAEQVERHARAAGFSGDALRIALAVARGESGWRTDALGDTGIMRDGWGPSVGLFQVRCRTSETGTGKTRDCNALRDPAFNARSAYTISNGGRNWTPWTVFTNGSYRQYLAGVGESVSSFIPPLARWFQITSDYGDPVAAGPHRGEPHYAIDFGAPFGEPVFSMADGVVIAPNANPEGVTGGNTVTIDYGNGIIASFSHLSRVLVRPGDRVTQGKPIGAVGNSGITTGSGGTSGAHLHLDTWQNGRKVNPLDLFDWTKETIDPGAYGKIASIPDIIKWLTDSTREDVGKRTWGEYATGFNTDFIGGNLEGFNIAATNVEAAVNKLGWQDKVIQVSDLPTMAAELFDVGTFTGTGGGPADWGAAIVGFIATVTNPETWARVAAMILGFFMAAVGAYMIWSAT